MDQNNFERLNFLSEKSLVNTLTRDELKEFKQLMDDWNTSTEFNLLHGLDDSNIL